QAGTEVPRRLPATSGDRRGRQVRQPGHLAGETPPGSTPETPHEPGAARTHEHGTATPRERSTAPAEAGAGEAALLARMLPHLTLGPEVEVGPGDDAAVVRLPSPRLVATTDTLVEGFDFLPHTT